MTAELTLYSRQGCHLCETMRAEVLAVCNGRDIEIHVVDVDASPDLAGRYGLRVPVLAGVDGELCYGRLDEDALEDYLGGF